MTKARFLIAFIIVVVVVVVFIYLFISSWLEENKLEKKNKRKPGN